MLRWCYPLLLFLGIGGAAAFEVLSQETLTEVVNGAARARHELNVKCSTGDEGLTFTVGLEQNGITRNVEITCDAPNYVYTNDLAGWVPADQYPVWSKVCLIDSVQNSSHLAQDSGLGVKNKLPSSGSIGVRRRLLSYGRQVQRRQALSPMARRLLRLSAMQTNWAEGSVGVAGAGWVFYKRRSIQRTAREVKKAWRKRQIKQNDPGKSDAQADAEAEQQLRDEEQADAKAGIEEKAANDEVPPAADDAGAVGEEAAEAGAEVGASELFAGAMAVGVAQQMMCSFVMSCGGGSGSTADMLQMYQKLQAHLQDVQAEVGDLKRFETNQRQIDSAQNSKWSQQYAEDASLRRMGAENTAAINKLGQDVNALAAVDNLMRNASIQDYDYLRQQIIDNRNESEIVWHILEQFRTSTSESIAALTAGLVHSTRISERNTRNMLHTYKEVTLRRALIDLFWRTYDDPTPVASRPFLNYTGQRPLNEASRIAMRRVRNGHRLTSVQLQRTVLSGGNHFAQQYNLSYLCDPLFALENVMLDLTYITMFDFVGPPGCYPGSLDATWSCNCVILVERRQCQIANDPVDYFPWGWSEVSELTPAGTLTPTGAQQSKCDGASAFTENTMNTNSPVAVITSFVEWTAFITPVCQETTVVPDPGSTAKVRVFSDYLPTYHDLSLSESTAGSNVCTADFARFGLNATEDTSEFLNYAIYQYWIQSYQAGLMVALPQLENLVYGKVASGLNYQTFPFNSQSRNDQTYKCTSLAYTKVSETKLPLYGMALEAVEKTMEVRVDGQLIHEANSTRGTNTQYSSSARLNGLSVGNVTVTTDVTVDTATLNLLPGTLYRLGDYRHNPGNPDKIWDVPQDLISGVGAPAARAGKVDFIFQGANWTGVSPDTPFSYDRWNYQYQSEFDASKTGPNPASFARQLEYITPERAICGRSYAADGVSFAGNPGLAEFCSILVFFDMIERDAARTQYNFRPHEWSTTSRITVPGGNIVQRSLSLCPSGTEVRVVSGNAYVTFNTTAFEINTLEVTVTSPQDTTACTQLAASRSYTATNPMDLGPFVLEANCQPLYINARPIGATADCFHAPGIRLDVSHTIAEGPGVPGIVQHAIVDVEDRTVSDLVEQMISTQNYLYGLSRLQYEDLDTPALDAAVSELTQKRVESLRNLSSGSAQISEEINKKIARINNNSKTIARDMEQSLKAGAAAQQHTKAIGLLNNLTALMTAALANDEAQLTADQAKAEASLQAWVKAYKKYIKSRGRDGCNGFFCNIFGGLFSFLDNIGSGLLGGILQAILSIFMMFLPICIIIALAYCIMQACMSGKCTPTNCFKHRHAAPYTGYGYPMGPTFAPPPPSTMIVAPAAAAAPVVKPAAKQHAPQQVLRRKKTKVTTQPAPVQMRSLRAGGRTGDTLRIPQPRDTQPLLR